MKIFVTFENAKEMLNIVNKNYDLFCEKTGEYISNYNYFGGILFYRLDENQVRECEEFRAKTGGYWSELLDGGAVYDDPTSPDFEETQISNLDFCEQNYQKIWYVIC